MAQESTAKRNLFKPKLNASEIELGDGDSFILNDLEYTIEWKALKMARVIVESFESTDFFAGIELSLGENVHRDFVIHVEETEEGFKKTITLLTPIQTHVDGLVFKIILDLLVHYSKHGVFPEKALCKDQEILAKLLYDVIMGADYLNIPELVDYCCQCYANIIKNSSEEQIKAFFIKPNTDEAGSSAAAGGGADGSSHD